MSTSNFQFPVDGETGPDFRDRMETAFKALVSNHWSDTTPPYTQTGMFQVTDTEPSVGRIRNNGNNGWVTLFPDVSQPNGGLATAADVTSLINPQANVYHGTRASTAIPVNAWTNVHPQTHLYDPNNRNTGSGYFVSETGWYDISLMLRVSASAQIAIFAVNYTSNVADPAKRLFEMGGQGHNSGQINQTSRIKLNAGEYVQIHAFVGATAPIVESLTLTIAPSRVRF